MEKLERQKELYNYLIAKNGVKVYKNEICKDLPDCYHLDKDGKNCPNLYEDVWSINDNLELFEKIIIFDDAWFWMAPENQLLDWIDKKLDQTKKDFALLTRIKRKVKKNGQIMFDTEKPVLDALKVYEPCLESKEIEELRYYELLIEQGVFKERFNSHWQRYLYLKNKYGKK